MGAIWDWIEKEISPPGVRVKNRRSLYRIIARISEQVAKDITASKREFFVRLAHDIDAHGLSKGIPRLPYDTDDSYRHRLAGASAVLSSTGEEGGLEDFLDSYVPGRWLLQDTTRDNFIIGRSRIGSAAVGRPASLVLYITNLISKEKENISAFLDWFLGADIEYALLRHGKENKEAISLFLNFFVPRRWTQIDKTRGYFKVGAGRIGITPIAPEIEVEFRIDNLRDEERGEIEGFLDWFFAGSKKYAVS